MIVRCGACRSQFEVPGAGRFSCPMCGSVNVVRAAGPPPPDAGGFHTPPPPPPPDPPSPKVTCPECEFRFIVGQIEVAKCPNCGADVPTGWKEPT
jgi:Zn finger protein HypA/HybF involved in hydrogenase expression